MRSNSFLVIMFSLCFLAGLFYLNRYSINRQVEQRTMAFVTDAVADIGNGWDPAVYKRYIDTSPESDAAIAQAFASYRRLGSIRHLPVCTIKDFSWNKENRNLYVEGKYECYGEFQNAPATVELTVFRMNDNFWRIRYFNVVSSFFTVPQKQ